MKSFGQHDFLFKYPRKTIFELNTLIEDGIFVVFATLSAPVEGEDWWYPGLSSKKLRKVNLGFVDSYDSDGYIFHLFPRYIFLLFLFYNLFILLINNI